MNADIKAKALDIQKLVDYQTDTVVSREVIKKELGTVTFFAFDVKSAMPVEHKTIKIEFNKPFVYMIRDSKTKEIIFFGVTYEPNEWEGSTCEELED